jgi:exodeoxyribonuclease VII small subunit
MTKTAKKDDSFSKKFAELEAIAESFETESVDLEAGLEKFERGLKLAEELKRTASKKLKRSFPRRTLTPSKRC